VFVVQLKMTHLGTHEAVVVNEKIIGCKFCGPDPVWHGPCPSNIIHTTAQGKLVQYVVKFAFSNVLCLSALAIF
jgi:hypothetical protein